jgi:DnaJ like chaperone protein
MALQGKLIGAGIGYFLAGPLGAVLGGLVGHWTRDAHVDAAAQLREARRTHDPRVRQQQHEIYFVANLVGILTAMMRADGQVQSEEVRAIRSFFRDRLGYRGESEEIVRELIKQFLKQRVNLDALCRDVASKADYATRLLLVQCLYDVAMADGHFHPKEKQVFDRAVHLLGIEAADFPHARAAREAERDYEILGVSSDADRDAVRSAYRGLVRKYHPDRVDHLGPEFHELAQQKFVEIQKAYERICAAQGWL